MKGFIFKVYIQTKISKYIYILYLMFIVNERFKFQYKRNLNLNFDWLIKNEKDHYQTQYEPLIKI